MSTHNIGFYEEISKIIFQLSSNTHLISSSDQFQIFQGFYCGTEAEFDELCSSMSQFITSRRSSAMFELHKERPEHWPPYEPYIGSVNVRTSGKVLQRILTIISRRNKVHI